MGLRQREELAKSIGLLDEILSASPDYFFIYDAEGRYLYVNQSGADALGIKQPDIIGRTWRELDLPPEIMEPFEERLKGVFATGEPTSAEAVAPTARGTRVYEYSLTPVKEDDAIWMIVAIARDVTERREAERALKESEQEVRKSRHQVLDILESITDGFFALDNDWRFTYINRRAEQVLGKKREDLLFRNMWEVFPELKESEFHTQYHRAKRELVPVSFQALYVPIDKWLEVHAYPYENGLSVYFQDVTERRKTEEVFRESEVRYRSLVELSPDAIIVQSGGDIVYVNTPGAKLLGAAHPDELIGKPILSIVHPAYHEIVKERIRRIGQGATVETLEEKYVRLDGRPIDVEVAAATITYRGRPAIQIIVRDISERKRIEQEREQLAQRIHLLLESTDEGIYGLDTDAKAFLINEAVIGMTGFTVEELLAGNIHEMMHHTKPDGSPYPVEECPVVRATREGHGVRIDSEVFWRKDGTSFPVEYSSYPIIEGGEIKGAVVTFTDITERRAFEREREETIALSRALNEIDAAITATLDFNEIMQRVIVDSTRAIGAESGLINLRENGFWEFKYAYRLPSEIIGVRATTEDAGEIVKVAIETKEPSISIEAARDERVSQEAVKMLNIRSLMVVPLITRGEVIGFINYFYHSSTHDFTDMEVDFAKKLGAAVSLALENARLFDELGERTGDLQTLLGVALDIAAGLDVDELMGKIVANAVTLTGAEAGGLGFVDEKTDTITYRYSRNLPEATGTFAIAPGKGLTGRVLAQKKTQIIDDYQTLPERLPVFAEAGLRATAMVPLWLRGRMIGTLWVASKTSEKRFDERDVMLLEGIGSQAAAALENARLYEAQRDIADTLQESLLVIPERMSGVEFGHLYRSATETARVGGDFYDIFELEGRKIGVIIGDVSGKGIEAAALTSVVRNVVKAHAFEGGTPARVLSKTNEMVVRVSEPSHFVTVFFGILDTETGELSYCSAGHPPAILKRADSRVELLAKHCPVIGAFSGMRFSAAKITLQAGDLVLLYTDGVIEARCNGGFYGEDRLIKFMEDLRPTAVSKVPGMLFADLIRCAGGRLSDDVAIFSLSLQGEGGLLIPCR